MTRLILPDAVPGAAMDQRMRPLSFERAKYSSTRRGVSCRSPSRARRPLRWERMN
jgi:hypothetical protein